MITIKKLGKNEYGTWCIFSFDAENLTINGIASTKLDKLEENHCYANLKLVVNSKNGKTFYNILRKDN